MIKTESLMKMGGVIALLATTLAVSDSATALNLTIGNTSNSTAVDNGGGNTIGQSFINDPSGIGTSILLNDWTFAVSDLFGDPLSSAATLKIYAGTGIGGTEIGSVTTYDSSVTLAGFTAAKWTFVGGLSLIDNQTYTAAVTSSDNLSFVASDANPYPNGYLTTTDSGLAGIIGQSYDTMFSANFSESTPIPFEFEGTGGLLVLGGGWLLRRHLKKRAKKDW